MRCSLVLAVLLGYVATLCSAASADEDPPAADETTEGPADKTGPATEPPAQVLPPRMGFGRWRGFQIPGMRPWAATETSDDAVPARTVELADNGDMRRRLEQIRQQIAGAHYSDAVRHLGQLLQNPSIADFFLNRDQEHRCGLSFRSDIRKLIGGLPQEGLAVYRLQFETPAKQALARALARGGESSLREVVQRFPRTGAAAAAQYHLGQHLRDHGRPQAAAADLERLQADAEAAGPFEPRLSLLIAACWHAAGNDERYRAACARLRAFGADVSDLRITGVPLADILQDPQGPERLAQLLGLAQIGEFESGEWTMFRGNAARNRHTSATAPFAWPRWTAPLVTDGALLLELDRSERLYRESVGTFLPLLNPLAVGDIVLCRAENGVAAYDLQTGARLWQHSLHDVGEASYSEMVWREPGGGPLTADAECVYLLVESPRSTGKGVSLRNSLVAREHCRGRQGNLRWEAGGATGGVEPRLADACFLGAPLAWQGRLYALVRHERAILLAVLDPQSGRLEWSQELALIEDEAAFEAFCRVAGASPSISSDGIAICPTTGGAVVAVDLTMQTLLWAYRYERRAPTTPGPMSELGGHVDQQQRWLDATSTIVGSTVVLTPAESNELHCLDLHEGGLLWKQPRGDGLYVACATSEAVVVAGKESVRALTLSEGASAWRSALALPAGARPSGRGVATSERYFLPLTAAAILEINLADGRVIADHRLLRETAPGNLIWHRGMFLSQGPGLLQAFDERVVVERSVSEALNRNPNDPGTFVCRGKVALAAGRLDDALADLRQAYKLQSGGEAKSLLTAALLDALRQNRPDRAQLDVELDQVAGR